MHRVNIVCTVLTSCTSRLRSRMTTCTATLLCYALHVFVHVLHVVVHVLHVSTPGDIPYQTVLLSANSSWHACWHGADQTVYELLTSSTWYRRLLMEDVGVKRPVWANKNTDKHQQRYVYRCCYDPCTLSSECHQ